MILTKKILTKNFPHLEGRVKEERKEGREDGSKDGWLEESKERKRRKDRRKTGREKRRREGRYEGLKGRRAGMFHKAALFPSRSCGFAQVSYVDVLLAHCDGFVCDERHFRSFQRSNAFDVYKGTGTGSYGWAYSRKDG